VSETHETIGEYLAEGEPVLALWHHLNESVGPHESGTTSVEGLTLPAATLYLVGIFEGQVSKGGFRQFLADPTGGFTTETLQALREVGAHVCVELLEKALAVFPEGVVPSSRDERLMRLIQVDEKDPAYFLAFDDLYNQHVDALSPHRVENLNTLLLDYMKEHAAVRLSY
jgi:Domain of unknown function (DUF4375)